MNVRKFLILTFGERELTIFEVYKKRKRIVVLQCWQRSLMEGWIRNGELQDLSYLSEIWQSVQNEYQIHTRKIYMMIPSDRIICRNVFMPNLNTEKIKSAIRINSDLYFPIPLTQYALALQKNTEHDKSSSKSWFPFGQNRKGREAFLAAAAPEPMIQTCCDFAESTHLKLLSVFDENSGAYRIFKEEVGMETCMTMCCDKEHIWIGVFEKGKLILQRRMKKERMDKELEQTFRYYENRFPANRISQIRLYGDGQSMEACHIWLRARYSMEIRICEIPAVIEVKGDERCRQMAAEHISAFGGAYLPEYFQSEKMENRRKRREHRKKIRALCLGLFFVMLLLLVYPLYEYLEAATENLGWHNQIRRMNHEIQLLSDYDTAEARYEEACSVQEYCTGEKTAWLQILDQIEAFYVKDVRLVSIRIGEREARAEIEVRDKQTAAELIRTVRKTSCAESVMVDKIVQNGDALNLELICVQKKAEEREQEAYDEWEEDRE